MANEYCKQCHKSVYHKCERIYGADVPPCAKAVVENCHSLQQLKAEIAAVLKEAVCMSFDGIESYELSIIAYEKLRQLTAV